VRIGPPSGAYAEKETQADKPGGSESEADGAAYADGCGEGCANADLDGPERTESGDGPEPKAETETQEAQARAREIVRQAESEAEEILAQARRLAAQERARAYDEGFLEGHIEGDRKAAAEFATIAGENKQAVERVLSELDGAVRRANEDIARMEGDIKRLVFEIVRKIVNVSYEKDDKFFVGAVESALERIKPEGKLTISVSEQDFERFFASGAASFKVNGGTFSAYIVKSPSLEPAEFIVDAGDVTVNAGLETQIRRVEVAFEKSGVL
jgi:flagellar assembly protein FliH